MPTIYVDQRTGNDKDSGATPALAFKTLGHAIDVAPDWTRIEILRGTFSSQVIDNDKLTIDGNGVATIKGGYHSFGVLVTADYVTLDNLKITEAPRTGVIFDEQHHGTIKDCEVSYNGGHGIYFSQSDFSTVYRNEVHHNVSPRATSGISIHQPVEANGVAGNHFNIRVIDNEIYSNQQIGVVRPGRPSDTDGFGLILDNLDRFGFNEPVSVARNVIYNNDKGLALIEAQNVAVVRNVFWHNDLDDTRAASAEIIARDSRATRYTENFIAPEDGDFAFTFAGLEGNSGWRIRNKIQGVDADHDLFHDPRVPFLNIRPVTDTVGIADPDDSPNPLHPPLWDDFF